MWTATWIDTWKKAPTECPIGPILWMCLFSVPIVVPCPLPQFRKPTKSRPFHNPDREIAADGGACWVWLPGSIYLGHSKSTVNDSGWVVGLVWDYVGEKLRLCIKLMTVEVLERTKVSAVHERGAFTMEGAGGDETKSSSRRLFIWDLLFWYGELVFFRFQVKYG